MQTSIHFCYCVSLKVVVFLNPNIHHVYSECFGFVQFQTKKLLVIIPKVAYTLAESLLNLHWLRQFCRLKFFSSFVWWHTITSRLIHLHLCFATICITQYTINELKCCAWIRMQRLFLSASHSNVPCPEAPNTCFISYMQSYFARTWCHLY